jgi:hypothetical protein
MTDNQLRQRLRQIGKRRQRQRDADAKLQADTRILLRQARDRIPTSEAAALVGLTRSTVYEVYSGGRKA